MWMFFESKHWGSHIPSSWMVHAGCVFVANIHPSRTWMSESFESVRWNVCVHRLDLGLYSHLKEFLGNGVRTHANSKGKIPSTRKVHLTGGSTPWRCIKQDCKPNTLPTNYSGPHLNQQKLGELVHTTEVSGGDSYNGWLHSLQTVRSAAKVTMVDRQGSAFHV